MDPVAYSVADVLKVVGISRTKFYELAGNGEIKVRKLGSRSIVLREDLDEFLRGLPILGRPDTDT